MLNNTDEAQQKKYYYLQATISNYLLNPVFDNNLNIDIFQYNKVFLPINLDNNHWILIILDIQNSEIIYIDSMKGKIRNDKIKGLKDKIPNISKWKVIQPQSPQQTDNYNCGIFVMGVCYKMLYNQPLTFVNNPKTNVRQNE